MSTKKTKEKEYKIDLIVNNKKPTTAETYDWNGLCYRDLIVEQSIK